MSRIRITRLINDERDLETFLDRGWRAYVEVAERNGYPPSSYVLKLRVPGIESLARRKVPEGREKRGPFVIRDEHAVRLTLPNEYPFRPPQVTFLDTHLHPNIYPNGRLCWGIADEASWWRGGDGLGTLVERLLHIVIGLPECTNPRSPANPDAVVPYVKNVELFPLMNLDHVGAEPRKDLTFRELGP